MNTAYTVLIDNKILILTFLFVVIGVVFNDYTNTIQGKDEEIYIIRIILISITISMLMRGLSEKVLEHTNNFLYYFLCIMGGWANYKLYDFFDITGNGIVDFLENSLKKHTNNNTNEEELVEKIIDMIDEKEGDN